MIQKLRKNKKSILRTGLILVVVLALVSSGFLLPSKQVQASPDPGWLTGWAERIKITTDQIDIDADLTNFPILVYLSSSSGRNSDDVTAVFTEVGANSKKIAVTTSDGTTQCYVEVEKWVYDSVTPSNSKAWLWVKAPSVSGTVDTDFYLYYDNNHADNTTYVGDPNSTLAENVWDTNSKLVTHMRDDPDNSHIRDSTLNNNDGTKKATGEPVATTSGKIDDAQDFDGVDDYVEIPHFDEFPRGDVTIEFWLYQRGYGIPASYITKRIVNGNGLMFFMHTGNKLYFDWGDGTSNRRWNTGYSPPLKEWVHLTITRDAKGRYLYVNGDFHSSTTDPGGPIPETNTSNIMLMRDSTAFQHYANGIIDEVRISKVARLADWIKATYETERDHLLAFGSEESNQAPNPPSALDPANYIDSSWGNDNTPTLQFTQSDPDSEDTVKYRIQIDDSSGFGSLVVDYTSALIAQGATSFTVGQATGTGTYTVGSESQTLSDSANYYWRVMSEDNSVATSSWATANAGAIAFKIDTSPPTNVGISSITADSTSQLTITALTATDSQSGLHSTPYWFNETSGNPGASDSTDWQASTSFVDSGLSANTQYAYQVKAKDAVLNESAYSATSSKYTLANIPSNLTLTADSQTQITANWQANNNPAGTEYFVENTTAGTNSGWITSLSWVSSNLTCGTSYSFRVKARNGDDVETSFTSEVSQSTHSCPGGGGMPEKIAEEIIKIPEKVKEIFKPKPPEIKPPEVPIEELVPKEAPLVFQGKWQLLPPKPIREFVLAPLPKEIRKLAEKFPELGETFEKVGITKVTDIEKLKAVKLTLSGLTERMGLPTIKVEPGKFALPQGVPIAELLPEVKEAIPSEIVFAKTGGELIDFNIVLSVNDKGEPQQKIQTISGKPLQLVVKPDKPVKSVKGYVVFKSKKPTTGLFQMPLSYLSASLFFANPVFAKPQEKPVRVEKKLVLLEFEYTDPDGNGIYTAEIQAPLIEGEYEIITVMDFDDPELGKKEIRLITVVDPEGYIYERDGDKETRIPGAIISLYWLNPETKQYEMWPAKEYQQENPQTTDVRGAYSFLVPEGYYYLKAETPGYLVYDGKPFQVKEGSGIHINIELKTKYWWLKIVDWKTILLAVVIILLLYNFYRDKIRERLARSPK